MIELNVVAAVVLSLLFEYLPGLSTWYDAKTDTVKRLIMLGMVVAVAAVAGALSCADTPYQYVTCDQAGLWELITAIGVAIGVNQGTHRLTKR